MENILVVRSCTGCAIALPIHFREALSGKALAAGRHCRLAALAGSGTRKYLTGVLMPTSFS